jgi:hypothetical protein
VATAWRGRCVERMTMVAGKEYPPDARDGLHEGAEGPEAHEREDHVPDPPVQHVTADTRKEGRKGR